MRVATVGLLLALVPGALPAQGAPVTVRPNVAAGLTLISDNAATIPLRASILELRLTAPDYLLPTPATDGVFADWAETAAMLDRAPLTVGIENCLRSVLPDRRERRMFDHVAPGLGGAARQYRVALEWSF